VIAAVDEVHKLKVVDSMK